jgi:pseudouridine-5'-phosphate glycosidase
MSSFLDISPEVAAALQSGMPVVALESTIISHGMPYPQNFATAQALEQAVRDHGAVPATIAVMDGRLKVGLSAAETDRLARGGQAVAKLSRRDLPFVLAQGADGATTVAATMIIAAMAGIRFFATGGIGGVHRDAPTTLDISADLQELARTDVAVVCAGAKAILDLGLTLEYLETHGVPVIGYRTDEFPAFYSRHSGLPVDYRYDTPEPLARALKAKWDMGLHGGVVIANPIPEAYDMPAVTIETAIRQALADAAAQGIKGKKITPFLLARIEQLTGGDSLAANIQLAVEQCGAGGAGGGGLYAGLRG